MKELQEFARKRRRGKKTETLGNESICKKWRQKKPRKRPIMGVLKLPGNKSRKRMSASKGEMAGGGGGERGRPKKRR